MQVAVLAGDFLLSRACVALASLRNTEVCIYYHQYIFVNENYHIGLSYMSGMSIGFGHVSFLDLVMFLDFRHLISLVSFIGTWP